MLHNARDVMAADVQDGLLRLSPRIDAEGESGVVVLSLSFADALAIET